MSDIARQDVFRFVCTRPVERKSKDGGAAVLIDVDLGSTPDTNDGSPKLAHAASARETTPIGALDQWLISCGDGVTPAELSAKFKDLSHGRELNPDLLKSAQYQQDRQYIAQLLKMLAVMKPVMKPGAGQLTQDQLIRGRAEMMRFMQILGLLETVALHPEKLTTADDIYSFLANAIVVLPDSAQLLATASHIHGITFPSSTQIGSARVLGMADLLVVRQHLTKYEAGEIANIENVLIGESKERLFRRTDTTELTVTTETETTEESSRDLTTTDRYELQKETAQTIHDDSKLDAGLTVTASGPGVSVTANAGYSVGHAQDESTKTALSYAKDVMDRSSEKITKRAREQRTSRTQTVIVNQEKHALNNKDGDNIVGVYRWVDKVYEAQVFKYGQRLQLEFIIPEPAAYFKWAEEKQAPEGITAIEPPPLVNKDKNPLSVKDVTPEYYAELAARYYARDIKPPPPEWVTVPYVNDGGAAGTDGTGQDVSHAKLMFKGTKDIEIPDGYEAAEVQGEILIGLAQGTDSCIAIADEYIWIGPISAAAGGETAQDLTSEITGSSEITLGGHDEEPEQSQQVHGARPVRTTEVLALPIDIKLTLEMSGAGADDCIPITDALPVAWAIKTGTSFSMELTVICKRLKRHLEDWQQSTFEAICAAYFAMKADYDAQIAEVTTRQGVAIAGRDPLENQKIAETELKKLAIEMLTNSLDPSQGGSIEEDSPDGETSTASPATQPPGPRLNFSRLSQQSFQMQFLEECCEWNLMTYVYYPYYWGRPATWQSTIEASNPDPLFLRFLQAGAARMVVPVRKGFELAMAWWAATGQPWLGGPPPVIGDPLYVSIAQEVREQDQASDEGESYGPSWEVRLPTTLVTLDPAALERNVQSLRKPSANGEG